MSEQEKKDKKFGMTLTIAIHALVIALFFILVAWREPDPPIPEYGIELNLGFVDQGGGEQESQEDVQNEDSEDDTPPDAEVESEDNTEVEQEVEEVQETVEETQPEQPQETVEEVQEEAATNEEVVEESVATQETADVKVEEEKKEEVEEVVKEEEKVEEKSPVEVKKEETPKPKPKPTVDSRALMGGKKTDTNKKTTTSNNQGTYPDKKGNEGDPDGKQNTRGTSPGGEDIGVSYSLDGWKWERPPAEKDDSQIDGVIKFAIDVDDRGKVLSVSVIPGTTISDNTIVDFYKKQVLELRFIQLDGSKTPAAISKGEVTFVIKTN